VAGLLSCPGNEDEETVMALAGKATTAGTQAYRSRFPALAAATLGPTGLQVSQAGFGGYRIDTSDDEHRLSLQRALRQGINLIDTSANYADGQSEMLIGEVLAAGMADGILAREEIVVVSKVGYVQGQNMHLAQQREQQGKPFPEMVKVEEGLWHCLHPEFLKDQLDRSLLRLDLETIDVYLLHNPEYFLKKTCPAPTEADRREYERRLQDAFRYLETEVAAGRISAYGISSNTFPAPAGDTAFTSLTRGIELAAALRPDHHFQVVQFPGNLYESEFALLPNQPDGSTVLQTAARHDLGVLINRPLNAFYNNRLIRLADVPPGRSVDASMIQDRIADVRAAEQSVQTGDLLEPHLQAHVRPLLIIGDLVATNLPGINGREQWHDVVNRYILPRVERVLHLVAHGAHPGLGQWQQTYEAAVQQLLTVLEHHYRQLGQERARQLNAAVDAVLDEAHRRLSLSQKAITLLRSLPGVDVVLVGMRQEAYVDDVLGSLSVPPVADAERVWRDLRLP
jgi:aryl-alcohol dehydrogenase-like predicted oxidoreductase